MYTYTQRTYTDVLFNCCALHMPAFKKWQGFMFSSLHVFHLSIHFTVL